MIYLLLSINIILLVAGQTLWKVGLTGIDTKFSMNNILRMFLNPYIFGGLIIYGLATVIWLYILSRTELSLVYPIQSLCYVVAAVVAILIFRENIPVTRWCGLGLIVLGAYFVSFK